MKEMNLESLLNSEMENIKGGGEGDVICQCTKGAGAIVKEEEEE